MTRTPRTGHGFARQDPTVLIVDANASRRRALASALQEHGPQVKVAESGAQALGMLHGEAIDALILDIDLPPRGAAAIVQRMKSDEALRDVVAVVLGDLEPRSQREQALSAGAEEFLPREVDVAELALRLRNLTQQRAVHRELMRRNDALSKLLQDESQRAAHFEQFSRNALDASGEPVAVVSQDGILVAVSQAFREFALERGIAPADIALGRPYPTLAVVAGDEIEAKRLIDGLMRVVRGDCDRTVQEFRVTSEPARWIRVRLCRFLQAHAPHVLLVHDDVTQQHLMRADLAAASEKLRESQAHVMHAQKLDAIGRLVGGVSHDFNNHLTSIICFTRFVVDEMAQEDPRRADLVEVLRAADNAARLTNQLLTFSRRRTVQPTVLDLNAALLSLGRVLRRMLGERVELVILPTDDPAYAMSDPGQFDQLIFSLALRAKDKMGEGGGVITFKLGYVQDESGDNLELLVSDTSSGMSAEQVADAFEPYSEPPPGPKAQARDRVSSGLDLAACAGIVQQAGGQISIVSEVGRGTTFRVLLPRVSVAKRAESMRASMQVPPGLHGTALVVEDQPAILRTMVRALKAAGLSVLEASSGEDAMAVLDARAAVPELVVTDMMLPGMSGVHLVERLRRQTPALPVVYVSGYSSDDVQAIRTDEHTAFVAKPFTSRQLISRAAGLMTRR
jgi:CheY-like chemotaxis protein